jgi:ADP-ribose pyrophosphatase YjhB (NUDIX family)
VSTPLTSRLNTIAVELAAMAQNGLTYATDHYDLDRYHRMRRLSADLLSLISDEDAVTIDKQLALEFGHATPKVDVRGALFDGEKVLLVREARDGRWTLPGGWADALDNPSGAAEREFAEEGGLTVKAVRLAGVYDGSRHNGHSPLSPYHIYKLFFLMERVDDAAPQAGLDGETTDVGYFALNELPPLSLGRTTAYQLERLLAHQLDPTLPTDFD